MEIILRDYRAEDAPKVVSVFREACQPLRKSRGGMHPDEAVDILLKGNDRNVLVRFCSGVKLLVAEVKETGELAGTGGLGRNIFDRTFGSVYSTAFYVRPAFQKGRAGVNVGSLLRSANIERAKALGCRKMYGFSTPEAIGWHKRFGARFFPAYNRTYALGMVPIHYYEIELRKSRWNWLKLEPYIFSLADFCMWLEVAKILLLFPFRKHKKREKKGPELT